MPGRLLLTACLVATLAALSATTGPAAAATNDQKMETCKFGADNDKLTGAKRDAFIKKCMANANYEPKARRDAMKKKPAAAATTPPAPPPPAETKQ